MKSLLVLPCAIFLCSTLHAQTYYVEVGGSNISTDMLNPGDFAYTFDNAPSGSIVYVKQGDYGALNLTGCDDSVQFIGYTTTPGDIIASDIPDYSTIDIPTLESVFPMLDGGDQSTAGTAVTLNGDYMVFKNFYIRDYNTAITSSGHDNLIENCVAHDFGNPQAGYNGWGYNYYGSNHIIRNCFLLNAGAQGITVKGDHNLIEGCKVYADDTTGHAELDYYILVTAHSGTRRGNHNIIRNCHVERVGNLDHSGHGLCLTTFYIHQSCQSGGGYCYDPIFENDSVYYNLIENCTSENIGEPVLLRGPGVQQNDIEHVVSESYGALTITTGASFNTFSNCHIKDTYYYDNPQTSGIGFNAGIEFFAAPWGDTTDQNVTYSALGTYPWEQEVCGEGNVFRNCLFEDVSAAVMYSSYSEFQDPQGNVVDRVNRKIVKDNKFVNCTFVGKQDSTDVFIYAMRGNEGNEFINCIINGFETWESRYSPTSQTQNVLDWHGIIPSDNIYKNCNFYNNTFNSDIVGNGVLTGPVGFVSTGFQDSIKGTFINCNTSNSGFVDAANNNFNITDCPGCGAVDQGLTITEMTTEGFNNITWDFNMNTRPCNDTYDIGAYEFDNCSTQSIAETQNDLVIYPNPANDIIYVVGEDMQLIRIYNLDGRLVYQDQVNNSKASIQLDIPNGVYLIEILLHKSVTHTEKFVKQ